MKTQTILLGPVLLPKPLHFNLMSLAPIKDLSCDRIMTRSIFGFCNVSCSFTDSIQISDLTNLWGVMIENLKILLKPCHNLTATQKI